MVFQSASRLFLPHYHPLFTMMSLASIIVFCLASATTFGQIVDDLNCTAYNAAASTPGMAYTAKALICEDTLGTASCNALFQTDPATPVILTVGGIEVRPTKCYASAAGPPAVFDTALHNMAKTNCAKTCGYCCISPPYACSNVQFPRLNCDTITAAQCRDSTWRTIIATDCPSSCGFCLTGGCVDAVIECANDRSICTAIGMQDFVNTNCRQTCARCSSTTTAASSGGSTGTCTSYIPNSSTACASWAANGFCTNTFYTVAQRRSYCATTCRIC